MLREPTMFDSVNQRFVTAIIFLAAYAVLETQFQLGIIASAALSFLLYWRCSCQVCIAILVADFVLFYCANKDYCHIPFLLSETLLLYYKPHVQVRASPSYKQNLQSSSFVLSPSLNFLSSKCDRNFCTSATVRQLKC